MAEYPRSMPRLRRSDSSSVGLQRVRAGRGFSYRDANGSVIRDENLRKRIERLAIPPAWTDVWISPHENGHILATGTDAVGRRQYIYHPTWREQKDRLKFDRALSLAESLPAARRRVTRDLHTEGPTERKALAAAFRMLDTGSLRVGSERYAEANGSRGLATLLCSHATVSGSAVSLRFPAKSGQEWVSTIVDADLAAIVRSFKRRGPRARLLAYKDAGRWHPLSSQQINVYVKECTGGAFSAKDFRTLHGTLAAAISLSMHGLEHSKPARARAVAQAMVDAAAVLSNTPAIARKSYVDPRLVDAYLSGEVINSRRLGSAESELRALLYR